MNYLGPGYNRDDEEDMPAPWSLDRHLSAKDGKRRI